MRMPLSSAMRASFGALRLLSSQPVRIFSVTGRSTAFTTASRMRAARPSSRISAEPAWPFTTFFTGQPKLMSISAAPRSALSFAASAMTRGSQPASCTAIGCSSGQFFAMVSDWRVSRIIASLAIISETTSPAPCRFTSRRNGRSVTPDIGARSTGSVSGRGPIAMLISWAEPSDAQLLSKSYRDFSAVQQKSDSADKSLRQRGFSAQQDVGDELDPGIGQGQQQPGKQGKPRNAPPADAKPVARQQQSADDDEGGKRKDRLVVERQQLAAEEMLGRHAAHQAGRQHRLGRGEKAELQQLAFRHGRQQPK